MPKIILVLELKGYRRTKLIQAYLLVNIAYPDNTWIYGTTVSFQCHPCPQNTYASYPGSSKCYECPAGHVAEGLGNRACVSCAAGKFKSPTGICIACPAGKVSSQPGSESCDGCTDGKFSTASSAYCSTVPAGKSVVKDADGLRIDITDCFANHVTNSGSRVHGWQR